MTRVNATTPRQPANPTETAHPGLTQALERYFVQNYGQSYSAVHNNPMKAVRFLQQRENIHERGIGPATTQLLRQYNWNYGYPAGSTAWSRFWAGFGAHRDAADTTRKPADYRKSSRNPAQGLEQPVREARRARPPAEAPAPAAVRQPRDAVPVPEAPAGLPSPAPARPARRANAAQAPSIEPSSSPFGSLFGPSAADAERALHKQLQANGRQLQPNHAYVVQIDRGGVGQMNGKTFVLYTDENCNLKADGSSFASSSRPSSASAAGSSWDAARSAGYPHLDAGMYRLDTAELSPATRGFAVRTLGGSGEVPVGRDADGDGVISAFERGRKAKAIMIHSDRISDAGADMQRAVRVAYGVRSVAGIEMTSAGCQRVHNFPAFVATVRNYAHTGATYVLARS